MVDIQGIGRVQRGSYLIKDKGGLLEKPVAATECGLPSANDEFVWGDSRKVQVEFSDGLGCGGYKLSYKADAETPSTARKARRAQCPSQFRPNPRGHPLLSRQLPPRAQDPSHDGIL
jgi:hypothetical protein